jgi:8-oxo-dGTP pyrophosphatase MutT (NUDIX family)
MAAPDEYYTRPRNVGRRTGAGGVIARVDPATRKVLIALIREPGSASFVLPKGGVDHGETLEQAAVREIREEAGFTRLKCLGELGIGERLNGRRTRWQVTHYFLFLTDQIGARPTEHVDWDVEWFALDKLPEMAWREQKKLIHDNRERIITLLDGGV